MSRMAHAGVEFVTTFALGCELQANWKLPTANAILIPSKENLPDYGCIGENFWNNVGGHAVADPFRLAE
ncbi:hypothetical protein [Rhodopila sp.]|uniref:hypothetical protein n=1 Tax=Rhodopila sp. TaxID=2480087 RepID=UPI003D0CF98F